MDDFEDIYETMLGLREKGAQVPWVENEFEENGYCAREYEDMRAAYGRICDRLGQGEEDLDLETMVTALENIQKELCFRSFCLGMRYVQEQHYLDPWDTWTE